MSARTFLARLDPNSQVAPFLSHFFHHAESSRRQNPVDQLTTPALIRNRLRFGGPWGMAN
jgi:hypothetical protein